MFPELVARRTRSYFPKKERATKKKARRTTSDAKSHARRLSFRFFAQPTSPSPPSASPLKIKKEDSGGAFQPVVLQHDDTPSPKVSPAVSILFHFRIPQWNIAIVRILLQFARMDYLSASASSGLPATPSTLSSPGSDSFAAAHRSHHKLSQASSGSDR